MSHACAMRRRGGGTGDDGPRHQGRSRDAGGSRGERLGRCRRRCHSRDRFERAASCPADGGPYGETGVPRNRGWPDPCRFDCRIRRTRGSDQERRGRRRDDHRRHALRRARSGVEPRSARRQDCHGQPCGPCRRGALRFREEGGRDRRDRTPGRGRRVRIQDVDL